MAAGPVSPILLAALGYLIGSIPFSQFVSRWRTGADLRFEGYRNVGAYNVVRTVGVGWGLLAGLLDAGKGMAVMFMVGVTGGSYPVELLAGLGAMLGQNYPIWLGFRGGKGVMVAVGLLFWIAPLETLTAVVVGFGVFWVVRLVNVSVSAGLLIFLILTLLFDKFSEVWGLLLGILALIGLAYLPRFFRWVSGKVGSCEPTVHR